MSKPKKQTKVYKTIGGVDRVRSGKTPAGKPYESSREVRGILGAKTHITKQTTIGGTRRQTMINRATKSKLTNKGKEKDNQGWPS